MKRRLKKVRRFILLSITWIMGIICLLSVLSIDSPTWIPTIALVISAAWLIPFGYANGWFE